MKARIKNILFVLSIVFIFWNNAKCNPSKDDIASYYGTWTVKKYRWGNAISAFDDAQASKYINKKVEIFPKTVIVFGDSCLNPLFFDLKIEDKRDLLYHFRESDLSVIPVDTIIVTEIKCSSTPVYGNPDDLNFNFDFILINEREMIMPVGGTYLYLEKEKVKERELTFKEFNGTGDFRQKIDLNSCSTLVTLEYNFYNIPDRILLEDADGNIFQSTEMETTNGIKVISKDVKLKAKEQCYFYLIIESSQKEKSKWEVKVKLSEY